MKIAVLAGDGVGPEIMAEAIRVLDALGIEGLIYSVGDVGAAAWRKHGHPLPPETLEMARGSDAVLFGAVGDPECDNLERALRPEQAILGLRKELGLFGNLRPAKIYPELAQFSPLKPELAAKMDIQIVRELTGDVYFGEPRGQRETRAGLREGFDTMRYDEHEIMRIAHIGFQVARGRGGRLVSVDKANVLETSRLWRAVVDEVHHEYPHVELTHMYADNAAMQIVRDPGQFDTILTANMFGDILSDLASMCVGSIGLLPSASMGATGFGLFEPIHGSAPDIAGKGIANPIAMILSAAMMLRHSLHLFGILVPRRLCATICR